LAKYLAVTHLCNTPETRLTWNPILPGALAAERGMMDFGERVAFISRALTFQLVKKLSELNMLLKI